MGGNCEIRATACCHTGKPSSPALDCSGHLRSAGHRQMKKYLSPVRALMWCGLFVLLQTLLLQVCPAYSVLTHEQVVDIVWKDQIQPLIKTRFPSVTEEDFRKAHAFPCGGSLFQAARSHPSAGAYF